MALIWCHGRDPRPHERVNTCAGLFEQALCTAMRRCGSTTSQTAAPSQCRGTSPRHTQGLGLKSRWRGGEGKLPERQRVALFLHSHIDQYVQAILATSYNLRPCRHADLGCLDLLLTTVWRQPDRNKREHHATMKRRNRLGEAVYATLGNCRKRYYPN